MILLSSCRTFCFCSRSFSSSSVAFQSPGNLFCGIGLDYKIDNFILNGRLGIREVREGRKYNNLRLRKVLVQIIRQGKAIHSRHADIRDNDIDIVVAQQLDRLQPVRRLTNNLALKNTPIDEALQPFLITGSSSTIITLYMC